MFPSVQWGNSHEIWSVGTLTLASALRPPNPRSFHVYLPVAVRLTWILLPESHSAALCELEEADGAHHQCRPQNQCLLMVQTVRPIVSRPPHGGCSDTPTPATALSLVVPMPATFVNKPSANDLIGVSHLYLD